VTTFHDPAAGNGSTRTTVNVTDSAGNSMTQTTTVDQNGTSTITVTVP
jgi:hypothetical protein